MSNVVYRATKTGLVVPERVGGEAEISRALKQADPDLLLAKEIDPLFQRWVWKVYAYAGDSRDSVHILDWRDDRTGEPLPLTSGIVDAVDAQRRDRPGGYDAVAASDAANTALRERRRAEFDAAIDDLSQEHRAGLDHGRVTVSLGAKAKAPYWQRNHHLPEAVRR